MSQAEILIAGVMVAVVGLSALARYLAVPYPIVLVIGGALLGFVPGLPEVNLNPAVARGCSTTPPPWWPTGSPPPPS